MDFFFPQLLFGGNISDSLCATVALAILYVCMCVSDAYRDESAAQHYVINSIGLKQQSAYTYVATILINYQTDSNGKTYEKITEKPKDSKKKKFK